MKVIHLCTDTRGGAARGMLNLHQGLLSQGVESSVITSADVGEQSPWHANHHRRYAAELLVWSNRTELSNSHFSLDCLGKDVGGLDDVKRADIIHLHWVSEFLTSESIRRLAALGKPLVWTLHDMRPFTGGCHFPAGCEGFKTDCSECPQLRSNYFHATKHALQAMSDALDSQNITFVAPSAWIASEFKASRMGCEHKVRTIPYGVDTNVFVRRSRALARKALGLTDEAIHILLASNSFAEKRKGLNLGSEVLAKLYAFSKQSSQPTQNVRLLFCGKAAPQIPEWIADSVGFVPPEQMPVVYNAADMMLFTPLEDNLPNVVLEAMACELPVISHRVGGMPDMLAQITGLPSLAKTGDVSAIADALKQIIGAPHELREQIGRSARKVVTSRFSLARQAKAYTDLYSQIVSGALPRRTGECIARCSEKKEAPFILYPSLEKDLVVSLKWKTNEAYLPTLQRYVEQRARYQEKLENLSQNRRPLLHQPDAWLARRCRSILTKKIRSIEARFLKESLSVSM